MGPKDHWTLKTGYFEDPIPAIQIQTLPLEGPRSLGGRKSTDVSIFEDYLGNPLIEMMTECQALKTARESGSMLNFHKTSDCVMCVKTDVFLQFSSPSLAPVCGTNCPKTDAFSAYDGCVFGIV